MPLHRRSNLQVSLDLASLAALQSAAPAQASAPNSIPVRDAITAINQLQLLGVDRELKFSLDPLSKVSVVQVLSRSTGEVIAQIPSELVLELAQNLRSSN